MKIKSERSCKTCLDLPLLQRRADARRGLHTATFISGYRGSPLGGFDSELERQRKRCDQFDIVHEHRAARHRRPT